MSDKVSASASDGPTIVFDALCELWSANACFGLRFDPRCQSRPASMQGTVSATLYHWIARPFGQLSTCYLLDSEQALRVL